MSNSHSRKFQDLTGKKFGRWTVLSLAVRARDNGGASRWLCRCECGTERSVLALQLKSEMSRSCGCLKRELDGRPRPWRVKHHCSREERSRIYRDRYREDGRTNLRRREWRVANLELARADGVLAAQKRRAMELAAPGNGIKKSEWDAICDEFNGACAYCLAPATTMDHVVALSRGGAHDPSNVVPACRFCNFSKHDKSLLQFVMHGRGVV